MRRAGFTLLEVMMALLLLATAIMILVQSQTTAVHLQEQATRIADPRIAVEFVHPAEGEMVTGEWDTELFRVMEAVVGVGIHTSPVRVVIGTWTGSPP